MVVRYRTKEQLARMNESQRLRRLANPEKVKAQARKSERKRRLKRYGLTEETFDLLFTGACHICSTVLEKESRETYVDHCHTTGKVRGILCHHCNILLGNAKDSVDILEKAKLYLEKQS